MTVKERSLTPLPRRRQDHNDRRQDHNDRRQDHNDRRHDHNDRRHDRNDRRQENKSSRRSRSRRNRYYPDVRDVRDRKCSCPPKHDYNRRH